MSAQQSCFTPFIDEDHLRFRYTGDDSALAGRYIRVILTASVVYIREHLVVTYQQQNNLDQIVAYNADGKEIALQGLTITYQAYEQRVLARVNTAIVEITGSTNALLIHRKGLIYHDELQAGYKGSSTIDEMKYRLAQDMVKHSEMAGMLSRRQSGQETIKQVAAALVTEDEVRRTYHERYYKPCLQALMRCAIEQLTCPPVCLSRREDNRLLRFDERKQMVLLVHPRYRQQISERLHEDEGQVVAGSTPMLINNNALTQRPPQALTLNSTMYTYAAYSLFGIFYVYEENREGKEFQPRRAYKAGIATRHGTPYVALLPSLPLILSKNGKERFHPREVRNDLPEFELDTYLVKGISANDVAQALALPEDLLCPHYGYEWLLLERPTPDKSIDWSDVVLVTWRCRTALYHLESFVRSVLDMYTRKKHLQFVVQHVEFTIKPSFLAIGEDNGQPLFLPRHLECLITLHISHPLTTKKVLRYAFDALSSRQPTRIEAVLDEVLMPEVLKSWSLESMRQRIHHNTTMS